MVGQHDTLRLHLGEETHPAAFIEALRGLPDVQQVTAADSQVVLIVPEAESALVPVLGCADRLNCRIRSVDIEEPNLEAVFLHLTGRALRD